MAIRSATGLPLLLAVLLATAVQGVETSYAQLRQAAPQATSLELEDLKKQLKEHPEKLELTMAYARALAGQDAIEARRRAVRVLQAGLRYHSTSVDLRIALGDLYYRQGYFTLARQQFRRALEVAPDTGPVYARLGRIALKDWLKFQRSDALIVAKSYWERAVRNNDEEYESWLGLGIIGLLAGDFERAETCARKCLQITLTLGTPSPDKLGLFVRGNEGATAERAYSAPDPRGEAWLMLGCATYELGKIEEADTAFSRALRYVGPATRSHLLNIAPVAMNSDTTAFGRLRGDSEAQAEFLRRFWRSKDPDLTTAANEVQLEYLARGAYSYFLYFDQRKQRWDERGAILVRYGIPDGTAYNPASLSYRPMTVNRLVWTYASLGMIVYLEDRYLNEVYDLPISLHFDMDPRPIPELLIAGVEYGDITVAGKGVFRARRPGMARLPGVVQPAMFRRTRQFDPVTGVSRNQQVGRVELYLGLDEVGADDEIETVAVVFDETWHELGRMETDQVSWCSADWGRIYQFNFELPEGKYMVGVSARNDSMRAEASWRIPITVTAPLAGHLELSDIELACEFVPDTLGSPFDKTLYTILPSPRNQVERGKPLGIYFEIYGLVPDETGYSRVSIEYTIVSAEPDKRPFFLKMFNPKAGEPLVQAQRTDETPGRVRFQYVSTELDNPEPGPYRLDIKVIDERSGQVALKSIDFTVTP